MKFRDFIEEMAYISGEHSSSSFSLQNDWVNHFKEKATLLVDRLPKNYKLYNFMDYYFLTNKNDEYLGYVHVKDVSNLYKKDTYQIVSSNSTGEVKGFYNIIFTSIFLKTDIKHILSDIKLILSDIKLIRLNKESKLTIQTFNKLSKESSDFDEEQLRNNPSAVVLVSENTAIHEVYAMYQEKLIESLAYRNDLESENDSLYIMLFTKHQI
jgi:hypothetical protein